jgi:hypothetical protein
VIRPVAARPPSRRACASSLSGGQLCRWKSGSCSCSGCHSGRSRGIPPNQLNLTQRDLPASLDAAGSMAASPNMPRCDGCRNSSQGVLFEQRSARFLKCSFRDHKRGWRIRRSRIIDPLHFRSKCFVFRLGISDIHRRPDPH